MRRRFPDLMRRPGSRWRAGGATLLTLPSGAYVDIDPANGVTHSGSPSRVTELVDQANSISFTPTTDGPEFVSSHAAFNGKPALYYERTTTIADLVGTVASAATSWTAYAIVDFDSTDTDQRLFDCQTGRLILRVLTGQVAIHAGTTRNLGAATTGAQRLTSVCDAGGTSSEGFRGDSSIGTSGYSAQALGDLMGIGNDYTTPALANSLDGHLGRLILYPDAHDASERSAVWAYLNQEYGL